MSSRVWSCVVSSSIETLPLFRVSLHLVQSLHLLYSTRRMRSMALWRYTTLLQVMSPNSSTTSTSERLKLRSSRMNTSTQTRNRRTRSMRNSTMTLSEKRDLHHCSFRSEKNSEPETNLSLSWRKLIASSVFFHTQERGDPYTNQVQICLKNRNQVATWKTSEAGFSLKDKKSKFLLKLDLRSRSTNFKPILTEEVSRK